jgi:EAL domain-containing protein (putative c-di-GMP-specific phosphodiesterase class I)
MTDQAGPIDGHMREGGIGEVRLLSRIDNLEHLKAAYGEGAGLLACEMVDRILRESGHRIAAIEQGVEGCAIVSCGAPRSLHALRRRLACTAMGTDGGAFHAAVTLVEAPAAREGVGKPELPPALTAFAGEPPARGDAWAKRYRADMAKAADLLRAIATDRIDLAWQPVVHAGDDSILYRECLMRVFDGERDMLPIAETVPSLERLGFARILDDYMMARVLDELEATEHVVLGVNISAQSAVFDGWWARVAERLRAAPSLAARLVIEITETASFPSISEAVSFVAAFHALGCRVALDDFGVGYASIRQLLALRPDIVKIDRSFVARTGSSNHARDVFGRMVGLAATLAPIVIAEGIETESHRQLAEQAGAVWQQGYHWGRPSGVRSWRAESRWGREAAFH